MSFFVVVVFGVEGNVLFSGGKINGANTKWKSSEKLLRNQQKPSEISYTLNRGATDVDLDRSINRSIDSYY